MSWPTPTPTGLANYAFIDTFWASLRRCTSSVQKVNLVPKTTLTYSTLSRAHHSIGNATTMAACGYYLSKRGVVTPAIKKGLAKISAELTIPALLFTSILACNQDWSNAECPDVMQAVEKGWIILFLPFWNVTWGLLSKCTSPFPASLHSVVLTPPNPLRILSWLVGSQNHPRST